MVILSRDAVTTTMNLSRHFFMIKKCDSRNIMLIAQSHEKTKIL